MSVGKPVPVDDATEDEEDEGSSTISSLILPKAVRSRPACAKRIGAIFHKPQFFVGGPPNVKDTRQGAEGKASKVGVIASNFLQVTVGLSLQLDHFALTRKIAILSRNCAHL